MNVKNENDTLRGKLEAVDLELVDWFERRLAAWQALSTKLDIDTGSSDYRPELESVLLQKALASLADETKRESLLLLLREAQSASRRILQPLTVAYLGPEGTYSEAAVHKQFGHAVESVPHASIEDVFGAVEAKNIDYGLVPVENSTEGGVNATLDCFQSAKVQICAEVNLTIRHCLLSNAASLGEISDVWAHSQSIGQCRKWLATNLPVVSVQAVASNAEAARLATETPNAAAIASAAAGELYGLNILSEGIQDIARNITRFLVIGQRKTGPSGNDRTSLMLSTKNRPGALFSLLKPLADHGISMTKIESRPSKNAAWEYLFFVDVLGHAEDPAMARALDELQQNASLFRILGAYPVAQ